MDKLIELVAQPAVIASAQAALAVSAMPGYMAARLPSPVVRRIREKSGEVQNPRQAFVGDEGVK